MQYRVVLCLPAPVAQRLKAAQSAQNDRPLERGKEECASVGLWLAVLLYYRCVLDERQCLCFGAKSIEVFARAKN